MPDAGGHTGECVLSQSLSAALRRVCQPSPDARKALTTSASRRRLTCALGFLETGRPRFGRNISAAFRSPKSSGNTLDAGLARRNIAAVHSGFSSSISSGSGLRCLTIAFNLPAIGLAKTDDMHGIPARSEDQRIKPFIDIPENTEAAFAVILAGIFNDDSRSPIQLPCQITTNRDLRDWRLAWQGLK